MIVIGLRLPTAFQIGHRKILSSSNASIHPLMFVPVSLVLDRKDALLMLAMLVEPLWSFSDMHRVGKNIESPGIHVQLRLNQQSWNQGTTGNHILTLQMITHTPHGRSGKSSDAPAFQDNMMLLYIPWTMTSISVVEVGGLMA
ncbi:uncharacterized protein LOC124902897 [Homo sapiens]|uniref:uncharacterized protein LOC124902897 n=1 Tax=Homo sapiens TaxID=9606 RepID=UPI001FB04B1C|nr:uncharacterized protein LOC124902897 [Homo sapiens]XP_047302045.1 uncharacterized protein LOC124902897 [Homo sapiens]